jgi:4-aminobutyrate aminotransferase-like enzyme
MGRSGTSYVRDDAVKGERSVLPIVSSQASWLPQVRVGRRVSCAAALVNIDYLLENRLADEADRKGKYLLQRLRELQQRHQLIGDVRGLGLMVGVELVKDRKLKTPAPNEASKIRELALSKGVLIVTEESRETPYESSLR